VAGLGFASVLRVNAAGTPHFEDDLVLARSLELRAIVLPKATPEAVAALGDNGPPVIAIVETARGVREAYDIARAPRVAALLIGAIDLAAEIGTEPRPDGAEILYARSKVVIDSAAAGIRPPFDIVHPDVHDDEGLEEECRLARSLGLRGKACIHPRQVPIVNRVLGPSESEVEWARGIVAAFESSGEGVLAVDGEMVDLPVVTRARRVLAEAERSSG
jgi:citrate lyase subunit beta/citryl-CoA lyase